MKRFLTLMTAIMMAVVAMAQSAGIILSYNKGKELKFYGSNSLSLAIKDAEVNDTIYLGAGTFSIDGLPDYKPANSSSYKEITKPLTFIGTGAHAGGTRFSGKKSLFLSADPSLAEDKKVFGFEGIYITDNSYYIRPASDLKEIKLVNVKGSYEEKNNYSDKLFVIDNLIVDRCFLNDLRLDNYRTHQVNVNNSKISNIYGGCNSSFGVANLDHCYVDYVRDNFKGLIKHSIVYQVNAPGETILENCYYRYSSGNWIATECTQESSLSQSSDDNPSSLGKCNDGTYYGTSGGDTPYTLYPQFPTADTSNDPDTGKAKSHVEYDALNKKLTITVKRLGE